MKSATKSTRGYYDPGHGLKTKLLSQTADTTAPIMPKWNNYKFANQPCLISTSTFFTDYRFFSFLNPSLNYPATAPHCIPFVPPLLTMLPPIPLI